MDRDHDGHVAPFPPDLRALIEPELRRIAILREIVQAKTVGYFTGKGETNLRVDLDRLEYTRTADAA